MTKAMARTRKPKGPQATDAGVPAPLLPRTAEEEALVAAWKTSPRLERPPRFQKTPSGSLTMMGDAELAHARLNRVFCGNDSSYTGHMLGLVANTLGISDQIDAGNIAVAMVHAIGPRDPVEALLASQMVAAHDAAMEMLRRARIQEQPSDIVDSCITRATRLMRTVTAQVTALKDYRSRGHQTVTVQHVVSGTAVRQSSVMWCSRSLECREVGVYDRNCKTNPSAAGRAAGQLERG
jgi:hypothetical protein